MNIIYFTMKKLNENKAFLWMLGFLLVFSCKSKDEETGDATRFTLTVTSPACGTVTGSNGINCGSKGTVCSARFDEGAKITLTATGDTDFAPTAWGGDCNGATCTLNIDANKTVTQVFTVSTRDSDNDCIPNDIDTDDDNDTVPDTTDVDDDGDGLVEIHNLNMFDHIKHDLAGTSYKTTADATGNQTGAPEKATVDCTTASGISASGTSVYLCGYELARDLDFAKGESYANGRVNGIWRPNAQTNAGGSATTPDNALNPGFVGATDFAGIFDGNGYSISNLYSRGGGNRGLFKGLESNASIRNLGVVDANIYGGAGDDSVGALVGVVINSSSITACYAKGGTVNGGAGIDSIGGLVGRTLNNITITASFATGDVNGGAGVDHIGGLVGNNTANIIASHATGTVNSGDGSDYVGGLVGISGGSGSIIASYATGDVNTGAGGNAVGSLVGQISGGTIIASFATGATNGGAQADAIGGLVGNLIIGTNSILASYATGDVNAGAGVDNVGGLVGIMFSGTNTITASYATGRANGGADSNDVGALVGKVIADSAGVTTNIITKSYGFGTTADVGTAGSEGDTPPVGVSNATDFTAMNADSEWNDADENTKDAWDFGTTSQAPALKYADYDGDGADFSCDMFPAKIPGTDTALVCGTTLLPRQGR